MRVRESGMPSEDYWETFFDTNLIFGKLLFDENITDAAEFGSGYGTFSISAAKIIKGILYCFDIDEKMNNILEDKISENKIKNIKVIQSDFIKDGTSLPNNSVDYVLLFNILHAEEPLKLLIKLLNESYRILKPGGKAGVIHWIYSEETPRGPSLSIRPKPDQCIDWLIKSGFKILVKPVALPPYHYGLAGIK